MADAYKGLTVKLGADTSSLSSALRKAKSEMSGVSAELRQIERALKLDPGNVKLLAQQQRDYQKAIKSTEEQLKVLRQAEKYALDGTQPMNSEQWTKLQSDIAMTEQKLQGYKQALTESMVQQKLSTSMLNQAGEKLEGFATKLEPTSRAMSQAGSTLTHTLTPAVVATGAAAFQLASDFETSMSQVAGALNDPNANMEELRQLALKTGEDTIFSATEAGNAMVELAKGGLTEADIKGGALATTMALAAAGNMNLADAANTVVQAMGAFGLSADQTGEAANALAGAAAASSADVSDLTQGLSQVSAQANSAGWSIQDTTAVLGAFADAGVTGSDAGTSLKTMLQRLAAPTDKAADMIDSLGINVRDSNGNMLDAAGVAQELTDKLGGLSSAEKDAAMQTIFGSDASRAALIMTNLGREGIEKYTAATNDQTAAQRLADSQMSDSARAIEEMKGAVETAAIKIGTALAPTVTEIAGIVGDAAEAFSSMSDEQQQTVIQTAALVAGLGPALSILSKLIPVVGGVGKGMQGAARFIANLSEKAGGAASSVGGLATEAGNVATKAEDAATNTGNLASSAEDAGNKAGTAAGKLKTFATNAAIIGTSAYGAAEATRSLFSSNADASGRFESAADAASDYAGSLGTVDANADGIIDSADLIAQGLDGANEKFESGNSAISGFCEWMNRAAESSEGAMGAVNGYFGVTEDNVSYAMTNIVSMTRQGWGAALAATQSSGGEISDETRQAALNMVDAMKSLPPEYASYGDEAMRTLASTMAPYWPELENYSSMNAQEIGQVIKDKLSEGVSTDDGSFQLAGQTAIEQLSSGLTYAAQGGTLDDATKTTVQQILNSFSSGSLPDGMQMAGTESMQQLAAGLSSQWPELANYANMSGDQIIQAISARLDGTYQEGADGGSATGQGYADALAAKKDAAVASALEVTGMTLEQFNSVASQAGIEGDEAVAAFANQLAAGVPLADAAGMSNATAATNALGTADGATPGTATGSTFATSLFNQSINAQISGQAVAGSATGGLATADGSTPGTNTGFAFASGIGGQSGNAHIQGVLVAGNATSGLGTGNGTAPGSNLGGQFSSGVGSMSGSARTSGSTLANSAGSGMQSNSGSAREWGSHLGENFANGIRSAIDWVSSAASSLAGAVASILGHTVPKEGPLRNGGKGETEWGAHAVQNFESGVRSQIPSLKKTMAQVTGTVAEALESPATLGANITASASAGKAASNGVNVTVEQDGGITEADVYNAMNAALSRQDGRPIIVIVKADDREIARVVRKYA